MNKYLNEPSNLKFNNSEEFKEYQKYKEYLVNKIKNNKLIPHKKMDKDTMFNTKSKSNDSLNNSKTNSIDLKENSSTVQGIISLMI